MIGFSQNRKKQKRKVEMNRSGNKRWRRCVAETGDVVLAEARKAKAQKSELSKLEKKDRREYRSSVLTW